MKHFIALLFSISIFSAITVKSQDFSPLKDLVLTDSLSCAKAQSQVLECCEFLLSTSCKAEINSFYASDFIIQWMSKTTNFEFTLNDKFFKTINSDVLLSSRYYAALAKYAIQSNFIISQDELQFKAISEFLKYCSTPKYKVEVSKKLQKYIDAKKENKLGDMLD